MGYRLIGEANDKRSSNQLTRIKQKELLSHGVIPGVVQVPANGQPIILLADCQTTGGYPKIACVIEADLWKIAQTPIGQHFCFIEVDHALAIEAQQKWQRELARIHGAAQCLKRYKKNSRVIDLNADLGEGGAYDAEILQIVSSANIACGGHTGDQQSMREAVRLAKAHKVAIGAHTQFCR